MGKYTPLGRYLRSQYSAEVPMSFADIERIIGAKLPPKAQRQRAWWSNNAANNVMTREWLDAGFQTERVDVDHGTLVFRRLKAGGGETALHDGVAVWEVATMPKVKHHPLFGALKGLLQVAPDTDLTAPADPEWGQQA
jgi:hypothetical protein